MHGPVDVKLKLDLDISTAFAVTLLAVNCVIGSDTARNS